MLSSPNAQIPLAPQASLFSGLSADAAIGRLPLAAVGASVASPEANNNRHVNMPVRQAVVAPVLSSASPSFSVITSASSKQGGSGGFSALFMAQLLGQSSASESGQLVSFFNGADAAELIGGSGVVKYKPSMAAFPRPEAPQVSEQRRQDNAPVVQQRAPAAPAPDLAAAQNHQQMRQVAEVQLRTPAAPQQVVMDASAPMRVQVALPSVQQAPKPEPKADAARMSRGEVMDVSSSATTARGVNSYLAAFSRNFAQLTSPPQYSFTL